MNLFFPVSCALPLKKRFMNDFIKNMLVTGSDFILCITVLFSMSLFLLPQASLIPVFELVLCHLLIG